MSQHVICFGSRNLRDEGRGSCRARLEAGGGNVQWSVSCILFGRRLLLHQLYSLWVDSLLFGQSNFRDLVITRPTLNEIGLSLNAHSSLPPVRGWSHLSCFGYNPPFMDWSLFPRDRKSTSAQTAWGIVGLKLEWIFRPPWSIVKKHRTKRSSEPLTFPTNLSGAAGFEDKLDHVGNDSSSCCGPDSDCGCQCALLSLVPP